MAALLLMLLLQVKLAEVGPAVAWHQDGTTHWEPHGRAAEHGFNFMAQVLSQRPCSNLKR